MAAYIPPARLQVITSSFAIAQAPVGRLAGTVALSAGTVHSESQLVLDLFAEEAFRDYTASRPFMGAYGIDETAPRTPRCV
jgi:DeoR family ulaG and ulaABCDEF operon transcriptional repressor